MRNRAVIAACLAALVAFGAPRTALCQGTEGAVTEQSQEADARDADAGKEEGQLKSKAPTVDKEVSLDGDDWSDVVDAGSGDVLHYRVRGTMPGYAEAHDTYGYVFVDRHDPSIDVDPTTARVEWAHAEWTRDVTDMFDVSLEGTTLTVSCDDLKSAFAGLAADDVLTLTYDAVLGDADCGLADPNENAAHIRYQTDHDGEGDTPDDVTFAYSFAIEVLKVSAGDMAPLPGAKFALRDGSGRWYARPGWTGDVASRAELVTDRRGRLEVSGIPSGTYELHELSAPEGYAVLEEPVTMRLARSSDDSGSPTLSAEATGAQVVEVEARTGVVTLEVEDPKDGSDPDSPEEPTSPSDPTKPTPTSTSAASVPKATTVTSAPLTATGDATSNVAWVAAAGVGTAMLMAAHVYRRR